MNVAKKPPGLSHERSAAAPTSETPSVSSGHQQNLVDTVRNASPPVANEQLRKILLSDIVVAEGRRALNEKALDKLIKSIQQCGLLQPPVVLADALDPRRFKLVFGNHRVEAYRRLKLDSILCRIMALSELDAELAEIEENVCRKELSVLERSAALKRQKELYEVKHGKAKGRGANAANARMGHATANLAVASFTEDLAEATGRSARSIQRDVARAEALGDDAVSKLKKTTLDSGAEVDALLKMSPQNREGLIERAAQGEAVSAVAELAKSRAGSKPRPRKKKNGAGTKLTVLKSGWKRAHASVQQQFIGWLKTEMNVVS